MQFSTVKKAGTIFSVSLSLINCSIGEFDGKDELADALKKYTSEMKSLQADFILEPIPLGIAGRQ